MKSKFTRNYSLVHTVAGLLILLSVLGLNVSVVAQSGSYGNTYIPNGAETVVFGAHSFQNGGAGTLPGIIFTERTSPQGYFSFAPSATSTGAADNAHVNGYVRKYGTAGFTFPIGNGSVYRPLITPAQSASTVLGAAYFLTNPSSATLPAGAPFPTTNLGTGVSGVSPVEYWDLDGTLATTVTLTWNAASNLNTLTGGSASRLIVVGYSTTTNKWENLGQASLTGTVSTTGSITSSTSFIPNTYLALTFGTATDTDGDGVADTVDIDDDNDGILDTVECPVTGSATSISLTGALADQLENNGTAVFPLDPPGSAVLPNGGITISSQGATSADAWRTFAPPITQGTINIDGISFSFPTQYLDLIGNPTSRSVTVNLGTSATTLSAISDRNHRFFIGIAGLGGNSVTNGENATITSSVVLTKVGNVDVFNTNQYSNFNGVNNPPAGTTGTVIQTSAPNTTFQGYTFFYVPDNTTTFSLTYAGYDPSGFIVGITSVIRSDLDGDGKLNCLDLDSDGDGIPDNIEAQTTAGYIAPGTIVNAQGLLTAYASTTGLTPIDTDSDQSPDYIDFDTDNDGLLDRQETGITLAGIDSDGDGLDDTPDTDDTRFGPVNADITNVLGAYPNNGTQVGWRSVQPIVRIDSPRNIQTNQSPTITGYATPGSTVVLTGANNTTLCSTTATANGVFSCTVNVPAGPNTVTATASNTRGSASTTTSFTVLPSVVASPDAGTALASGGTVVADVRANDIVNGGPATSANSSLSLVSSGSPGVTLNTTTGSVSVASGTAPGSYTLIYSLCTTGVSTTCTTSFASVTVLSSVVASPDAGTAPASGGTAVADVRANDVVNGLPASSANSSLSLVSSGSPGVTLNTTTGSVSVASGTAPGSYTLTYSLCTTGVSTTCTTSYAAITVTPSVTAGPDAGTVSSGTGGNAVADVRTNDVVNGALPTTANSTLILVSSQNSSITLNTVSGSISVAPGTTPGSYTLTYQLCDKLSPVTCTTGLATITITPSVTASPDAGTASSGTGGTAIANVRANDMVNGAPATSANSSLSLVSSQNPGITLNTTTGSVSVAVGTAPGSYTLVYQLCSTLGTTTCTTGLASVTVTPSVTASPDAGTALATGGIAVINATTNDLVNGVTPILSGTAANATLTTLSSTSPGITLNPGTGSISVTSGTPPGTYTLVYQICTIATPVVCATTTATVTVLGPDLIIAIGQPTPGLLVGQTSNLPVTVSNIGAVPTSGPVNFTLSIPASVTASATFTSNGFTCATSGTLVSCSSSATIANGASTTVIVPLTPLAASAGTSPALSATVVTGNESNLNNNTTTTTVGPIVAPDLTILIGQASPALAVGQTSIVLVTVSNIGTAPTSGLVSFTLSIPASVTVPATFTSNGFGCVTSGTLVSCSSSAIITNGASTTVQVSITPLPAAAGTSPVLSATVAVANEGNTNNNTAATTVTPAVVAPDLTISIGQPSPILTIGVSSAVPVIVSNIGTAPTSGPVNFTLSIPASTTAPAAFISNGFGCVTSGMLVTCSSSAPLVNGITVTVSVPVTATTVSVSPVFSATVITVNESNPNNNTATITASAVLAPDLTVSINQPSPVLVAGQTSSVPVTISNIGTTTTLGPVSFTLSIPATLTAATSFTSNGFTCATSGRLVTCSSSATIANGASTTLAIPITPLNAAVGTSPVLSGTVATVAESNVNNNTAVTTVTTPVAGQPDLVVSIGQPSPNLVVGQISSVPVSLSNIGTAPTAGPVSFTLSIPASVTASATFTSNGFTCATSGTLVSCSSPNAISNGASTTVLVPITPLAASTGTSPILSVTVATGNESNPNNNTATTTVTTPVVAPDLIIAIGQPNPALVVGQTGSIPVSLSNIGTAPTAGPVSFTLRIPASMTVPATFTSNGYSCATSGTLVSCSSSATITNGTSMTIQVPITPLTASAGTSQLLSATVATVNESNGTNNTATTTVTISASVVAAPDPGIASAGTGGTAVVDVRANDVVNGAPATAINSTLILVSTAPGITFNTTTGSVSVAQGTTPGSYTLVYQLCDKLTPATCTTALATITVTASVTAGPDAGTASAGIGGMAVADVRANDVVNGVTSTSANSTLALVSSQNPGITFNATTGLVSVAQGTTPGSYTLTYQLCDKLTPTTCTTGLVTITVTASITASPDAGTASAGTGGTAVADVRANDVVNGAPATTANSTLALVSSQNPGITFNATTGSVSVAQGTTPGSYTLVYQLCDKLTPTTCTTGLATITVTASITASPDAGTVNTGIAGIVVMDVRTNDVVNGQPATSVNSSLSLVSTAPGITLNTTTGSVNVAVGTAPGSYTLVYQLCSTLGSTTCTTSYVSVTVTGSAPLATPDIADTQLNTPVIGNLLTNDSDPQGLPLTVSLLSPPAVGTVLVNPDGSYTYTPPTNFTGTVSFCYSVSNTAGLSSSACVSVNVAPGTILGNNKPIANNDNTRTSLNMLVTITVLANDTDPDSATSLNGQLSSPTILSQPTQGTAVVNPGGTITYTPPTNFTGIVSFPYQVCDKATPTLCATATVSVNVQPAPPAGTILTPVLVDDALLTQINTPKSGDVSTNDSDPQGLPLTYTTNQPTSGTVVMSPTGMYTYTPAPGFTGPARFSYSVCNSAGKCALATTTILVQALAPQISLLPQVYLQGALFGVNSPNVLMRDDLRTKGLIPTNHPYAYLSPITPVGTMSPSVTAVTGNNAIVDWVFLELRSATNGTTIIDSRAALLQRDGDVVDVDGVLPIVFSQANPGNYYVAVRHRNHLGVMSLNPLALSSAMTTVDFRNPNTPTFTYTGTTSYTQITADQAQVVVQQGVAMWAGNALVDNASSAPHNFVIFQGSANDPIAIAQQTINPQMFPNFILKGYYTGDVNLNGETIFQGTGNDVEFIRQNVINNHPGNVLKVPIFTIREQLP